MSSVCTESVLLIMMMMIQEVSGENSIKLKASFIFIFLISSILKFRSKSEKQHILSRMQNIQTQKKTHFFF